MTGKLDLEFEVEAWIWLVGERDTSMGFLRLQCPTWLVCNSLSAKHGSWEANEQSMQSLHEIEERYKEAMSSNSVQMVHIASCRACLCKLFDLHA